MALSRRGFLIALGVAGVGLSAIGCAPRTSTPDTRRMPDEGAPHDATWMSYAVSDDIWGADLAPAARETLLDIAAAIGAFEPVRMVVPRGETTPDPIPGVEFVPMGADDLWMRDTGPTFVLTSAGVSGVDFNFNGWGDKQEHEADAGVAAGVCSEAGTPRIRTDLVLEGGALEVDGDGTAIITESCVLNDNRNPGWTKADVEAELYATLGIEKVIWLPGIAGKDITDGHTDFYARFASPGVVVAGRDDDPDSFDYAVTREHLAILEDATDARGRALDVRVVPAPDDIREDLLTDDFAAGYINFYVCNGAVIMPEFGDAEADEFARATIAELFPDRQVVQLNIDAIAAGGGGIHCTTQQQPTKGAADG